MRVDVEMLLDVAGLQEHFATVVNLTHVVQHPPIRLRVKLFDQLVVFQRNISQTELAFNTTRDFP